MKTLARLAFLFAFLATPAMAAHYDLDKSHTRILFFISHLGFSNMPGMIREYDGTLEFDEKNPEASKLGVKIYSKSVDMGHEGLNKHLQSKDFFNTAQYPEMSFTSTKVKVTGANTADVTGNFTLLGITKPLVLHVTLNKIGKHPMTQEDEAGFSATGTLKRSDFGMTYGIPNVGDEVQLRIEAETLNRTPRVEDKKAK